MLPRYYMVRVQPEDPRFEPFTFWVASEPTMVGERFSLAMGHSPAQARILAQRAFRYSEILSVERVYPCTDCRGLICTCGRDVLAYDGP